MKPTVAVIGGGVVGSLIARELTKYHLKVVLIEAREDVATGATGANSAIVHGGFDPVPGTLKAKLNVKGAAMMPALAEDLGVSYKNNGSLVLAFSEKEMEHVRKLYDRGIENGVPGLSVLNAEELQALEPNISREAVGALLCSSAGIVCPYSLAVAAAGNAADNGAELLLASPVTAIEKQDGKFLLTCGEHTVEADYVLNCAGVRSDEVARLIGDDSFAIKPRAGEYLLLDKSEGDTVSHTIFQTPNEMGKGILVTPTVHGNLLVGPTALNIEDKSDTSTTREGLAFVRSTAMRSVPNLNFRAVITSFTGVRSVPNQEDFIIRFSEKDAKFLHVAGIESPGLSSAPAIAPYVVQLLADAGLALEENKAFDGKRKSYHWFSSLSVEEKNAVIRENPAFGRVVCRCETVTEGEIVDAIHRAPKATTLDGLKHRLRSGMGRCQGGFCTPLLVEILARELGISPMEVQKSTLGSNLLIEKTKEVAE